MIKNIQFSNFGPISDLNWQGLANVNLIIGDNGTGKTFLLKGLYTAIRTIEEYQRGDDQRSVTEILAEKLYWTFQSEKIGDIVSKGVTGPLSCSIEIDHQNFNYSFGKETSKNITNIQNNILHRDSNSIFLPAKEVLSLDKIILKSREQDKLFGFDDTYFDLVKALQIPKQKGKNFPEFSESRRQLENIIDGKIEYDESSGRWIFKKGNAKFSIGVTAEGIKKIAILDTLLGNRYLTPKSIVLIDEPEAALHPTAINEFLDIIAILAERGMQFFLATHSYFVIKKLYLIAQQKQLSIPLISAQEGSWNSANLLNGLPANSIIDESIRLYKEEVELVLQ
jgi:AAA15 family ATPase/GTPase